jgi:hypothetical protein
MTTEIERNIRFHDDAVDWFLRTYPGAAIHVAKRLVITARRQEDNREHMVFGYRPGHPIAPSTLFVCVESIRGRAYQVVGWAWGENPNWYKSDFGTGLKWLIHDNYMNTRKTLPAALRSLKDRRS